jgi:hypothetical protein
VNFQEALSDPSLPPNFLQFYITQLIIISVVNLICLFGIGYLLALHTYLRRRGITTFEYIIKGGDEIKTNSKKRRLKFSENAQQTQTEINILARIQSPHIININNEEEEKSNFSNYKFHHSTLNSI